jgi:hypothetical protein
VFRLEIEPLDLGPDVKAIGLELGDPSVEGEPVRGEEAARIWSRVLPALAANEPWALDFFSHTDRARAYCDAHHVAYREASPKSIMIPSPDPETLEALLERFEGETFGARAGALVNTGDSVLEGELARRGVDAYHAVFANYLFCAVCDFENGSLVLLTTRLWASEAIRRIRPVLSGLEVQVQLPV